MLKLYMEWLFIFFVVAIVGSLVSVVLSVVFGL